MNSKYPCIDCIVNPCCSKHCDDCINYFSRLIRSYDDYGNKSRLYKASRNQLSYNIRRKLTHCIDFAFNIKMINIHSGHYTAFNSRGTIIERG